MKRSVNLLLVVGVFALFSRGLRANEPFLKELPAGVYLKSSLEIPSATTKSIGQKLGGELSRITNSVIQVHGHVIQVNGITAVDEANAKAVEASLLKIKPHPFCIRKGSLVIEYVGRNIDPSLALKASYELGLLGKPESVRYQVIAELATVDKADYMACNPLFNQLLAAQKLPQDTPPQQVLDLSKRFQFGRTLKLTNPMLGKQVVYRFEPAAMSEKEEGATKRYNFGPLPNRHGVPYVTATIDVTVDGTGFQKSVLEPSNALTAATTFWPVDDPEVKKLAQQITAGKTTNTAKSNAILEWLSPGKNVKYSGQTGSRWGTAKVLEQKFGHCWDFSDCYVTLARAAGIPCRQVAGWLYGSSGHVWAEYYREREGWQQVDPTGGGKLPCGIYHIAYFMSEDGEMPIVYVAMPKLEMLETK